MTVATRHAATTRARSLVDWIALSLDAATRSADGVAPPASISWCDAERQWLPLIPRLREILPQLYALGAYQPDARTGPAIWLLCVVDRALPEASPPDGIVPILYLPGVSRHELRAGSDSSDETIPLVELQYRGAAWHQVNGRDWTVEAALRTNDLDVAQDARTREAILRSLPLLGEVDLDTLRMGRLEEGVFDRLSVEDVVRDMLRWLNDADACRKAMTPQAWDAFRNVTRAQFGLDPGHDAPSDATARIVRGDPKWESVWTRFREAPRIHPGVGKLLHAETMVQGELALDPSRNAPANVEAEYQLRAALQEVARLSHHDACARVDALEKEHGRRRGWVWTQLDESPYAIALAPLARLAERASSQSGAGSIEGAISAYASEGHLCDTAAMQALAVTNGAQMDDVIGGAVRALYLPWLDKEARAFQQLLEGHASTKSARIGTPPEKDICILFADGLRYDLGSRLAEQLQAAGCEVTLSTRLAAIPTATPTARPAVTPVASSITGPKESGTFVPVFSESGKEADAVRQRAEMERRGIAFIPAEDVSGPASLNGGWTECGKIDYLGHNIGLNLARELDRQVEGLEKRIRELLEAGWNAVRVVTDHGWLLMPGGLPKVDLPAFMALSKWARCAIVKGESAVTVPTFPWSWNPDVKIASPPGAGTFIAGAVYAHGGVSPQECVTPELLVRLGAQPQAQARIANVRWSRLRCRVTVSHASGVSGLMVDLRTQWTDASKSIAAAPKAVDALGEASVVVPDDALEGTAVQVVLVAADGTVLDKRATTVGDTR